MARFYYCECGVKFGKHMELKQHLGICNPRWPRRTSDDEHWEVTEQQWHDKRNAAYRRLRDG